MSKVLCEFWCEPKAEADPELTLRGKRICRWCADKASRAHATPNNGKYLPCPCVNEKNEVIPYGEYPNIDWS